MKITKDIKFNEYKTGKPIDIFHMFDDHMKAVFNLTDEEYDYILDKATDEELKLFANDTLTFAEKRQILQIRKKYLTEYHK
jgi:hypothetical protein